MGSWFCITMIAGTKGNKRGYLWVVYIFFFFLLFFFFAFSRLYCVCIFHKLKITKWNYLQDYLSDPPLLLKALQSHSFLNIGLWKTVLFKIVQVHWVVLIFWKAYVDKPLVQWFEWQVSGFGLHYCWIRYTLGYFLKMNAKNINDTII